MKDDFERDPNCPETIYSDKIEAENRFWLKIMALLLLLIIVAGAHFIGKYSGIKESRTAWKEFILDCPVTDAGVVTLQTERTATAELKSVQCGTRAIVFLQ